LKKFSKSAFDLDNILTTASQLKYTREIRRLILEQMQEPSDEFVKFIAQNVYNGRITQPVKEQFAQLLKQAFRLVINEQINERLKSALSAESDETPEATIPPAASTDTPSIPSTEPEIATTKEELDGFYVVRAIVREVLDVKRVVMKDVQSYCAILADNNNRRPICRLYFNRAQKYIGLFGDPEEGSQGPLKEERISINDVDEIYNFADRLKATAARYESIGKKAKSAA
jgi:hypothetical protein